MSKHVEEEKSGNIWGWKVSIAGLILIVALAVFAVYRHLTMDIPFGMPDPNEIPADSTVVDTLGEKVNID